MCVALRRVLALFPTGEGSFGRVLQAKAEGIVPGMPDRNVVAIKTTKGTLYITILIDIYVHVCTCVYAVAVDTMCTHVCWMSSQKHNPGDTH